jgi:hypothetical protein
MVSWLSGRFSTTETMKTSSGALPTITRVNDEERESFFFSFVGVLDRSSLFLCKRLARLPVLSVFQYTLN